MFCPVLLGAEKTIASVAAGNTAFHPAYMSCGNIHNEMRRSHREAVVPIAFLSIPKGMFLIYSHSSYVKCLTSI